MLSDDRRRSLCEIEVDVELVVIIEDAPERQLELLQGASPESNRNHIDALNLERHDLLQTVNLRLQESSGHKHLDSLSLDQLFPVVQELFHAAVVVVLQEVFKAFINTEALVFVSQEPNIDQTKHILISSELRTAHDDEELLLGLCSELQGDLLSQLLAEWVLDVPALIPSLTVYDLVFVLWALFVVQDEGESLV